jgi:hypothetical protein
MTLWASTGKGAWMFQPCSGKDSLALLSCSLTAENGEPNVYMLCMRCAVGLGIPGHQLGVVGIKA